MRICLMTEWDRDLTTLTNQQEQTSDLRCLSMHRGYNVRRRRKSESTIPKRAMVPACRAGEGGDFAVGCGGTSQSLQAPVLAQLLGDYDVGALAADMCGQAVFKD
jgi:hypothetical protein